jgi:hypothetical protein
MYPGERAAELLRFFRDHMRDAPDDLMAFFFLLRIPPVEVFPEEYHGALVVDFVITWLGPVEDGEAVLAPFRAHGEPIFDMAGTQPYAALQQSFDAGMSPKGNRWYSRYHYLDELTDEAVDAIVDGLEPFPGELTTVYLADEGGAVGRVPRTSHQSSSGADFANGSWGGATARPPINTRWQPTSSWGNCSARSAASSKAAPLAIKVVERRMPVWQASTMPALMPRVNPKSSAVTMRRRMDEQAYR